MSSHLLDGAVYTDSSLYSLDVSPLYFPHQYFDLMWSLKPVCSFLMFHFPTSDPLSTSPPHHGCWEMQKVVLILYPEPFYPTYPLRETIEGPKPAIRAQWPPGISRRKLSLGQAALRADKWGLTVFLSSGSVKSLQTSQKNWGSSRLGVDLLVMQGHRQTKAIEGNKTWWNRKVKDGSGANCRQRAGGGRWRWLWTVWPLLGLFYL